MTKILLQECSSCPEEKEIEKWCNTNHIEVCYANNKKIQKKDILMDINTLPVGNIDFMNTCFHQIGYKPEYNCYPDELRQYMDRDITETLVKKLPHAYPFFIKPSRRLKKFTGKVINSDNDLYGISRNEYVWLSPVIDIMSEWRIYISNGKIVFKAFCDGNRNFIPDDRIIDQMIADIRNNPQYCCGCVIDIAVSNGNTIFLELNEGYSVGKYYDMPVELYISVLNGYWRHIYQR